MGKATKATKKFVASGQLKKTIQQRHKHQQIRRKVEGRKGSKNLKSRNVAEEKDKNEDKDEEDIEVSKPQKR